ncbi:uncharacterized protein TNIN_53601 [Trichonephila inaurata madagascariensis]|uniref:Uncharacterized protein n=1 Tax=Trichonephila inaurata madagascariensis TaxID=2747483 RepID=A0A8X6YTV1_9ARAC|nr:uncharacterized protein TNIN_53601 [Trichonephila inaurata madagascariensis]
MSSHNAYNHSFDTGNQSRVRKPPGGDTNDIFDLEIRQNLQAEQKYLNKASNKQDKDPNEQRGRGFAPVPFAGITEQTRIRKPPGGDTNDIFGLEVRQKSQANVIKSNQDNISDVSTTAGRNIMSANTNDPSHFDCSLNQLNANNLNKAPSYQLNKENINITLDKMDIYGEKFIDEINVDNLKIKEVEEEEESKNNMKKYLRHNPITGEVSEMDVSTRPKLVDRSNLIPNIERTPIPKKFDASRTSIRVRQPPGGASSNIF